MAKLVKLLNVKKTQARCKARTAQIKIGETYFLSAFYDVSGAMVKVLAKSTAENKAGWHSSVTVEVISEIGDNPGDFYKPGKIHTVNATNLYGFRVEACPKSRRG